MSDIGSPHDKFFKEVFSRPEVVADFLLQYLPPHISQRLEPNSALPLKDSFVDHTLQEQFSDLLFSVKLKSQQESYVYVLFEHKSHPEPLIAFHLLRYMVKIWEKDWINSQSFRWILPLVIYHGSEKWNAAEHFGALFPEDDCWNSFVPDFRYVLCDLSRYPDENIEGIWQLRAVMMLMKYIFRQELRDKLGIIFQWIQKLGETQNIREFVITVLLYLINTVDQFSYDEIQLEVEKAFVNRGDNAMPTIAEQLIEKGRKEGWQKGQQEGWQKGQQEGWQKGQQEGWHKGQQESIIRILKIRFASTSPEMIRKIQRIEDSSILESLLTAVVTVQSCDEFLHLLESY